MTPDLIDAWTEDDAPAEPVARPLRRNTGAAILDEARAFIARFVIMPSDAALTISTIWAAHTHVRDTGNQLAFDTTPRLAFLSDKPASGKTRAMETVGSLSHHAEQVLDITPTGFCTMISENSATVMWDEIDLAIGTGGAKATVRSLLNSGYRRGAVWRRANKDVIPVFAPVVLAGLGTRFRASPELAALRSRCIIVEMTPRVTGQEVETFRAREHMPTAAALRHNLATWVSHAQADITEAWPDMPDGIEDRLAEIVEPLLMIADAAGGHWPDSAREAIRELLLGETETEAVPIAETLLTDLAAVFAEAGYPEHLSTIEIVEGLLTVPHSPWSRLWPNEGKAPRELAALLTPLGVGPVRIRQGERTLRGYRAADLAALWDQGVADVADVADVAPPRLRGE